MGRARLVEKLATKLRAGGNVALYAGLPGAGKTALAHHLMRDETVQRHFANILWTGLGQNPDIKSRLQVWARELEITTQEFETLDVDGLAARVHQEISREPSLLIIDDAWSPEDALSFRAIGDIGVARLLTTRDAAIARAFTRPQEATEIEVLEPDEADELTRILAPTALAQQAEQVRAAMGMAGGLPITIILLASYLEDAAVGDATDPLTDALANVRDAQFRVTQRARGTLHDVRWDTFQAATTVIWKRLSPSGRRALTALALFPPRMNSFSLDAAKRVGDSESAVRELYRLRLITRASGDKTAADRDVIEDRGDAGKQADILERYWMHQAIADFAHDATGSDPDAYKRMADYLIDYIDKSRSTEGRTKSAWLEGLEVEQLNLGAALEWAEKARDAETGLRLTSALFDFWYERGRFKIGRQWIDRILSLAEAQAEELALLRAKALNDSGNFAYSAGDLSEALERHEKALAVRGDDPVMAGSLNNIALVYRERGEYERADALFQEAIQTNLRAEAQYREAADERRMKLHINWRARNLNNLGRCAERRGELDRARQLQEESLALFTQLEHDWGIAMARGDLGAVLLQRGERAGAEKELRTSFEIRWRIKDGPGMASALRELARIALVRDEHHDADRYLRTALNLSMDAFDPGGIALALQTLARLRVSHGDARQATTFLAAADHFRHGNGFVDPEATRRQLDHTRELAHAALGSQAFDDAWLAGQAAEMHEVANYALNGVTPSPDDLAPELGRVEMSPSA